MHLVTRLKLYLLSKHKDILCFMDEAGSVDLPADMMPAHTFPTR